MQAAQRLRVSVAGKPVRGVKLSLDFGLPAGIGEHLSVECVQGACSGRQWAGDTQSRWKIPTAWIAKAGAYRLKVSVGGAKQEVAFNVAE